MGKIAAIGFCLTCALWSEEAASQQVQVTKTDHMDFAAGGLLKLNGAFRTLTIEGWDQPGMEITTTKTTVAEFDSTARQLGTAELDQIKFATGRNGNELDLTSMFPRHGEFYLDTHIYLPRSARLAIHGSGDLYIDDVTGATQAYVSRGTIVVHLPEQGKYDIDAHSKFGTVNSDFPGEVRRHWAVGHEYADHPSGAGQKLALRAGYGDIILLKINVPRTPAALKAAS